MCCPMIPKPIKPIRCFSIGFLPDDDPLVLSAPGSGQCLQYAVANASRLQPVFFQKLVGNARFPKHILHTQSNQAGSGLGGEHLGNRASQSADHTVFFDGEGQAHSLGFPQNRRAVHGLDRRDIHDTGSDVPWASNSLASRDLETMCPVAKITMSSPSLRRGSCPTSNL